MLFLVQLLIVSIKFLMFLLHFLCVSVLPLRLSKFSSNTVLKSPPMIDVFSSFSLIYSSSFFSSNILIPSLLGPYKLTIVHSFSFIRMSRTCILPFAFSWTFWIVCENKGLIKIPTPHFYYFVRWRKRLTPFLFPLVVFPISRKSFL